MKRKKLLEFASWLERRRGTFDMTDCSFCMSGWCDRWLAKREGRPARGYGTSPLLSETFGLSDDVGTKLYFGESSKKVWGRIKRSDAVKALRNVAYGRKKVWSC